MTYRSNVPAIKAKMAKAVDAGLEAAVEVPVKAISARLEQGFTSGDFVSGESAKSVERTEVMDVNGNRAIKYGTSLPGNLYWELGFLSVFTKKFERVEVWVPISLETRDEASAAFKAAYAKVMG